MLFERSILQVLCFYVADILIMLHKISDFLGLLAELDVLDILGDAIIGELDLLLLVIVKQIILSNFGLFLLNLLFDSCVLGPELNHALNSD